MPDLPLTPEGPVFIHPDGRREPMRRVGGGLWAHPDDAVDVLHLHERPRPQAEPPPDPNDAEVVHPLVRFWRWLWNPPTPEPWPGLVLGKPVVLPEDFDPGPVPMPMRTGGPRSTPPRTGSR